MLLGGLWHGAALRFILWGLLHGVGLVINRIWNYILVTGLKMPDWPGDSRLYHVPVCKFLLIFFRAPDMDGVNTMLRQITGNFSPGSYMTVLPAYSNAFLLMIVGYTIHFLPEKIKESYRGYLSESSYCSTDGCDAGSNTAVSNEDNEVMPFIYFRF